MKILIVDDEDIQRQKLVHLFPKARFLFLIFYVHLRYRLP